MSDDTIPIRTHTLKQLLYQRAFNDNSLIPEHLLSALSLSYNMKLVTTQNFYAEYAIDETKDVYEFIEYIIDPMCWSISAKH